MVNVVVGLDSNMEIAGTNGVFEVMCPIIGLFVGGNSGYIFAVNLKGEIYNETGKEPNGSGQRASTSKAQSAGLSC